MRLRKRDGVLEAGGGEGAGQGGDSREVEAGEAGLALLRGGVCGCRCRSRKAWRNDGGKPICNLQRRICYASIASESAPGTNRQGDALRAGRGTLSCCCQYNFRIVSFDETDPRYQLFDQSLRQ